ncbi:MAG TPA: hypothetical protein VFS55_04630 [Dokdonella sp.]|nr:hypothetical protein [Dokdonella sp.]
MFREQSYDPLTDAAAWQHAAPASTTASFDVEFAFTDRTGELSPVYREIARRIAREAYTRHASTLGDALR